CSLRTFAEAAVTVEAVLFARTRPGDATAVAVQWLDARQRVAGDSAAPGGVATAAWRTQLLQAWPRKVALARPHRVWSRLARLRLQRELAGKPAYPPPVQQLWHSWRAASGTD
ncbi:phytoene synthase, partial [Xanthomonas vasicola pv. vasculorum NCPPB 895]